jgi:hypothetical protein
VLRFNAYGPEGPRTAKRRAREYLRERFLSHRLHPDYDAVVDAACRAWNRLTAETGRLLSLCADPWIQQVVS